jgi:2-polyprenyl-3-methyl-5-hydroxy-6-metoxy-1,4-benzoquinol methylase
MSSPLPAMLLDQIRSRPGPNCYMCGAEGDSLYQDLKDRYFTAPGVWNMKKCPNATCGLVWLDPIPLKEDIGKAYQTYYTHSEDATTTEKNNVVRRLKQEIRAGYLAYKYGYNNGGARLLGLLAYLSPFRRAGLDFGVMYLPNLPGGRLLEVGCGNGRMLKMMADLGWLAEGVDFDAAAAQNGIDKGLNIHTGFLEELQYEENCFDAITMSHVIEHVHDPLELLKECCRILKPGGRFALVTPNIGSIGHRLFGSSWFHLDPPRHLRIFSVKSLRTLLQMAGFRSINIGTTIRGAAHVQLASRSVRRTGRYEWGSRQSPNARVWGSTMQAIEWAWLNLDRQVGEEIAAVVQK